MNYRQLQQTCKALSTKYGISFNCKLNATKSILQATLDSLINLGYITDSMLLDCGYYDSSAKQEELVTDSTTVEAVGNIKPEAKAAPFNAHVEMWSLLARASEMLTGIVTLDFPDDYRGYIQDLSSKLGKFIYFNIGYRFSERTESRRLDDLETAKRMQIERQFSTASIYLKHFHSAFYINGLDERYSPYFKACKELISSLT